MPSSSQSARKASIALAVVVVLYAVVVGHNILSGIFLAALIYLFGWLVSHFPGTVSETLGQRRAIATGVLVAAVLGYSLLVTAEVLLGVVVALTVVFVSWATTPGGPVARWLAER
jgi:hypothetical protein